MNLELLVGHPSGSRLVADYLGGHPAALAFFGGDPALAASYAAAAEAVAARFNRAARARAAACARAPTPAVRARLGRLVEEDGFFVTTGQQPGLFTGPLYSIYKALTAARLADALESLLERPVVPLFWVASEDHDWKEVDHTHTVSLSNQLRRFALETPERGNRPIHRLPMGDAVTPVLDELLSLFPDNDFKPALARLLRSAYTPGNSLGQAFTEVLADWLGPLGMAFVDASSPPLKRASRRVLDAALDGASEQEAQLTATAEKLRGAGYHVQVPILPGGANLFLEGEEGGRERVYRDGRGFRLRRSGARLTRRRILAAADEDPRALSPNVLLRPVVESAVFPVVSYVAGPGEIAYFAQLRDLFETCGAHMPVVHPRFSVTIVEPKIRKVLDKLGLSIEDLARPFDELSGELAGEAIPDGLRRALEDLRGGIGGGVERLVRAAATLDPTLRGPAKHIRTVALDALEQMRRKVIHSLKRERRTTLRQLAKAQVHLYPQGGAQERSLNACYYLARYGPEFLRALHDRFSVRLAPGGSRAVAANAVPDRRGSLSSGLPNT